MFGGYLESGFHLDGVRLDVSRGDGMSEEEKFRPVEILRRRFSDQWALWQSVEILVEVLLLFLKVLKENYHAV